jgi:hypothetical protein
MAFERRCLQRAAFAGAIGSVAALSYRRAMRASWEPRFTPGTRAGNREQRRRSQGFRIGGGVFLREWETVFDQFQ